MSLAILCDRFGMVSHDPFKGWVNSNWEIKRPRLESPGDWIFLDLPPTPISASFITTNLLSFESKSMNFITEKWKKEVSAKSSKKTKRMEEIGSLLISHLFSHKCFKLPGFQSTSYTWTMTHRGSKCSAVIVMGVRSIDNKFNGTWRGFELANPWKPIWMGYHLWHSEDVLWGPIYDTQTALEKRLEKHLGKM